MVKSFTLHGRRHYLHPQLPAGEIEWLVNRMHISLSDDAVVAAIERRSRHWPERFRQQAERYALHCHHRNQRLVARHRL